MGKKETKRLQNKRWRIKKRAMKRASLSKPTTKESILTVGNVTTNKDVLLPNNTTTEELESNSIGDLFSGSKENSTF